MIASWYSNTNSQIGQDHGANTAEISNHAYENSPYRIRVQRICSNEQYGVRCKPIWTL